jgi:aryl-alcohol dehydrogenase-like predicted oxidoreductase
MGKGQAPPEGSRASVDTMNLERFTSARNLEIADAVAEVARALGRTPSQVALAWVMGREGITSPIFGARTLDQLEDDLAAAELVLDERSLERLEEVSRLDLVYPYDFHARVRAMMGERRLDR